MVAGVKHYFRHFSQTLRSITLYDPFCSPRELSCFLSLFPNLDNIGVLNRSRISGGPSTPEAKLIPFSAPKPEDGWHSIALLGLRPGHISSLHAAYGSVTWTCARQRAARPSCSKRVRCPASFVFGVQIRIYMPRATDSSLNDQPSRPPEFPMISRLFPDSRLFLRPSPPSRLPNTFGIPFPRTLPLRHRTHKDCRRRPTKLRRVSRSDSQPYSLIPPVVSRANPAASL